jgi:serine acetyltransferase
MWTGLRPHDLLKGSLVGAGAVVVENVTTAEYTLLGDKT